MRVALALLLLGCSASPKPTIHFAGDPEKRLMPTSQSALTALVGGEIRVDGTWGVPAALSVTCTPACTTEPHGAGSILVHPPGVGRLMVTATLAREGKHDTLTETRVYDIVVADDIGLVCRDVHGAVLECDAPQDAAHGTAEVVVFVHGRLLDHVGGMRVDGKEVAAGAFSLAEVVDVHAPGLHTVEVTGGGLHKKTVIAIAPSE